MSDSAFPPTKAHNFDAGFDLACPYNARIKPNDSMVIGTHLSFRIPYGFYGQLIAIPSVAEKGIVILGGAIQFGFTGEIRFTIFNLSRKVLHFPHGTRIAHLILHTICYPILREAPKYLCEILEIVNDKIVNSHFHVEWGRKMGNETRKFLFGFPITSRSPISRSFNFVR